VCKRTKERELLQEEFDMIKDEVKGILALEPAKPEDVLNRLAFSREKVLQVIQWMLDNDFVTYTGDQRLTLQRKE